MKANSKPSEVVIRDTSFRVKPLVRHAVTYLEDTVHADGSEGSSGGTICEVGSEEAAVQIQKALELFHAPRMYVVVQSSFEPGNCIIYYAYTRAQAEQFQDVLQKHYQANFCIYEKVLTDSDEIVSHQVKSGTPLEYLMVRDGQVILTHIKAAPISLGRKLLHFSIPEGTSEKEAMALVKKTLDSHGLLDDGEDDEDWDLSGMPEHDAALDRKRAKEAKSLRR